jgi:hypothetical protein
MKNFLIKYYINIFIYNTYLHYQLEICFYIKEAENIPTARGGPGFEPGSGHVGFVVDKVALEQVFSEYFGFPCQSSFHQLLHNHPHLSSWVCTIGQKWPQYLGTKSHPINKKKAENF